MRKKASYEEISLECAKHALEFLHYIATFHNLNPSELYEVRKFIHIISGYNRVLKKYKEKSENQQLKELLKECHTQLLNKPIRESQYDIKMAELKDLLKRIYEAIK